MNAAKVIKSFRLNYYQGTGKPFRGYNGGILKAGTFYPRAARGMHFCSECGRRIVPGTQHLASSGGEIRIHTWCGIDPIT